SPASGPRSARAPATGRPPGAARRPRVLGRLPPRAASGTIERMTDRTPRRGPAALRPPRLPRRLDGPRPAGGRLADGTTYAALALAHADLSGQAAAEVGLAGAVLEAVNLGGTDLPALRLTDVRLAGCDLANASWRKARWERVEGTACRAVGL